MARSVDTDYLNSSNFYLLEIPSTAINALAFPIKLASNLVNDKGMVSFSSITLPTSTIQTERIQEGNWPFVHTVALSSVLTGQVTIRQAVAPANIDFSIWFSIAAHGRVNTAPRKSFIVVHTRNDKQIPRRQIILWDCIPVSWTASSELNGSNPELVMEELTMEVNRIEVVPGLVTGI